MFAIAVLGIGVHSGPARAGDLSNGDLLVGAGVVDTGYGNWLGGIYVIRGSAVLPTPYCQSPMPGDPGVLPTDPFSVPSEVLVDRAGDVLFLAEPYGFPRAMSALYRCRGAGQAPEKLAIFPVSPVVPSDFAGTGYSLPFGTTGFVFHLELGGTAANLFVKPTTTATLDDSTLRSLTGSVDAMLVDTAAGYQEIDYDPLAGVWTMAPIVLPGLTNFPSRVAHGDTVYTARDNILDGRSQPLMLDASGTILGTPWHVSLGLFGGDHQVVNAVADNRTYPGTASQCMPEGNYSLRIPSDASGGKAPLALARVLYDEKGPYALSATSSYAPLPAYLGSLDQRLLDSNPLNDDGAYYLDDAIGGCPPIPYVSFDPVLPSFDDDGNSNGTDGIAATSLGLVGTQKALGRVVAIRDGGHHDVTQIASGIPLPTGIAGYPNVVSGSGGIVIVIRIDSPIDALLTAMDGRRIGIDPVTHQPVNDFGDDGYVGDPGEPRFIAVRHVAPGAFRVDSVGTGDGTFAFHVYSNDLTTGATGAATVTGTATTGTSGRLDFLVASDATVSFTSTFTVGGTVSGLTGSVVLKDNGSDALTLSTNGSFTFSVALTSGSGYSVSVAGQPVGQTCSVTNGAGTISNANVDNVAVTCSANSASAGPASGRGGGCSSSGGGGEATTPLMLGLLGMVLAARRRRAPRTAGLR